MPRGFCGRPAPIPRGETSRRWGWPMHCRNVPAHWGSPEGGRGARCHGCQARRGHDHVPAAPWHEGGRLKTEGAERTIPLWPQRREILAEYLAGYRRHLPGQVLFPSPHVEADRPLTDLRDLLDRVAVRCVFLVPVLDPKTQKQRRSAAGQLMWTGRRIRTRVFRQTYCTARLQTLDHGRPVSLYTVAQEFGHESEEMVRRVYARLGTVRHRAEAPEVRPEQWFGWPGASSCPSRPLPGATIRGMGH